MLKKGFLKPEISVESIGKQRFWTGIILGFISAFIISYLFSYSREAFRLISLIDDLFILPEKEFRFYDLFYSFFAASIGLGITIISWLSGKRFPEIKKNYIRNYAISNIWFVIFLALSTVSRFGSVLSLILFRSEGSDNHLNFIQNFWLLLLLIPTFILTYQWNIIRLIFRTKHWIIISYIFCFIAAFYLYKTTAPNRDILNDAYYFHNKERFEFIKHEMIEAKRYGVSISDSTEKILQRKYTEEIIDLVVRVQNAFETDSFVSIDTLILQKIIIHNLQGRGYYYWHPEDLDKNWSFAFPEQIYRQIIKYDDINSPSVKVLFELLYEQIALFDISDLESRQWEDYTRYDYERLYYNWHLLYSTRTIRSRLIQVIDKLKSTKQYEKYYYLIPDIQYKDERYKQEYYELNI